MTASHAKLPIDDQQVVAEHNSNQEGCGQDLGKRSWNHHAFFFPFFFWIDGCSFHLMDNLMSPTAVD